MKRSVKMVRGRWWKVVDKKGKLWCETSDEREARMSMRPGDTLFKEYVPDRVSVWVKVLDDN